MALEGPNPFYAALRGAGALLQGRPRRERVRLYEAARAALEDELHDDDTQLTAREKAALQRLLSRAIRRFELDIKEGIVDLSDPAPWAAKPAAGAAGSGGARRHEPLFRPAAARPGVASGPPRLPAMALRRQRNVSVLARRFVRDAMSTDPMAQLWAIAEPILQIGLVVMIYLLLGRHLVLDMPAAPFAALGIAAWLMFRQTLMRTGIGIGPHVGLLALPRIAPIDIFLARALVVAVMYASGGGLLLLALAWFGHGSAPDDPLGVLGYWMLIWISGFGLGMTMARLAKTLPMIRRMTPIVVRLLLFISGVVFVSEQLPEEMAAWFLWNPMLHAMQLLRSCWFPEYTTTDGNPAMIVSFASVCLALGLMSLRAEQRRVAAL